MPAPEMTEEKKNDLLVLQMRKTLDPKQFYKAPDMKAFPKFFQVRSHLHIYIIVTCHGCLVRKMETLTFAKILQVDDIRELR